MNNRVLSIQSHIVFGYVGNKCATFPLQVLGFDFDALNTVQFSNHPKYGVFKGQVLNKSDLDELMEGIYANGLERTYTHLLSGYIINNLFLKGVVDVVKKLKEQNSNLIYVCDPVLGDDGKLYVPEDLITTYRDYLLPLADVTTPNQTELQYLSGLTVNTVDDAVQAIDIVHNKGCNLVIMTSAELSNYPNKLTLIASKKSTGKKYYILMEKLPYAFSGTGDLFASLFLGWNTKLGGDICAALEHVVSCIHKILKRTFEFANNNQLDNEKMELKLIQSKIDIENPQIIFKCQELSND